METIPVIVTLVVLAGIAAFALRKIPLQGAHGAADHELDLAYADADHNHDNESDPSCRCGSPFLRFHDSNRDYPKWTCWDCDLGFEPGPRHKAQSQHTGGPCPACGGAMNVRQIGAGASVVQVDECGTCAGQVATLDRFDRIFDTQGPTGTRFRPGTWYDPQGSVLVDIAARERADEENRESWWSQMLGRVPVREMLVPIQLKIQDGEGEDKARTLELHPDKPRYSIGSSSSDFIQLESLDLPARAAALILDRGILRIEAHEALAETLRINGRETDTRYLAPGDRITFGDTKAVSVTVEARVRRTLWMKPAAMTYVEVERHQLPVTLKGGGVDFSTSEKRIIIGRDPKCDVVLPDSDVSARHCILNEDGSCWRVSRLPHAGYARLNGRIVERSCYLANGDTLKVGNVEMVFHARPLGRAIRVLR